jgi:hypothetical protein
MNISLGGGAGGSGGAILAGGTVDVTNSTFVGNQAGTGGLGASAPSVIGSGGLGGSGGAIAGLGTTRIAAATMTLNGIGVGGAGAGGGATGTNGSGGGVYGSATVRGSIVAANDGSNCGSTVIDGGGNLAFPEAGGCGGFKVADPKLDPVGLAANGGPTATIALLPGSAALALVPAASCQTAAGEPLTVDQRGVGRPAGACDAGAYEVDRTPPASPKAQGQGSPPSPPDTKLTKKPRGRVTTHKKRVRVAVGFSSDRSGAVFECRLDKSKFRACKSPKSYKVKLGRHAIEVRAVLAGAVDPTPAKASFKVVKTKKKSKHRGA